MKILVLSDSHGSLSTLEKILIKESDAATVVHLGDGADEMRLMQPLIPVTPVITVRGNCDPRDPERKEEHICTLAGKRFFFCHGHTCHVKTGLYTLWLKGKQNDCDVCLYGHTHQQHCTKEDGILLFNPGAVCRGEYGILTADENGVNAVHKTI
ncbi:MAG: metallophosphoesterase [Clostridia bacterium]|nr:metallophosphoesterase [Clostridia bacterium]